MNPAQPKMTAPNPSQPQPAFKADIVGAIPLRVPGGDHTPALHEDDELEKIMRDVGSDLKKDYFKSSKKRWLDFKRHPKAASAVKPAPHQLAVTPMPAKAAKQAKARRNLPIYLITMTISVTTALIVAAFIAYK
jgi:hypothetical protein